MKRRQEKKSPLKHDPLRNPGQSLEEQRDEFLWDAVVPWVLMPFFLGLIALLEWYRVWTNMQYMHWAMTVLAVASFPFALWRISRVWPSIVQMNSGLKGERVVGQGLERLRADGYEVFHDILGDGHNIDHVLVGPGGVFAVETKTISKTKGDERVVPKQDCIVVAGHRPDRDPIAQARAAARELRGIVLDRAGLDVSVRPVILYPGWFVEPGGPADLWVLNEKALPAFLANERPQLSDSQIRQIGAGISRHVWDAEKAQPARLPRC